MVHYRCNKGFTRYGSITSYCTSQGMWIPPHPTCIKNGCPSLLNTSIANGRIQVETKYKQAVTSITCDQGYIRQGPEKLLCDGVNWSGGLPQCVKAEIKKDTTLTCDFEGNHICGWSHNTDQVARWTRWAGPTFSSGTGPDTDHTHGSPLGHYLFIESTVNNPIGNFADFTSMIFSPNSSINLCLEFYFHMMGEDIGSLTVNVKPVTNNDTGDMVMKPLLLIEGDQGSQWNRGFVHIPEQHQPFQIVFRGSLKGIRGDIAVDDVNIFLCSQQKQSKSINSPESSAYESVSPRDNQTLLDRIGIILPINKRINTSLRTLLNQTDTISYNTSLHTYLNQTDTISYNTSLHTYLNQTDTISYNTSLPTSLNHTDTNSYNTSLPTSLNQTDTISYNTSLQTSVNPTDAKSYNTFLQTSLNQTDANSYNTSLPTSLNQTDTISNNTSLKTSLNQTDANYYNTSLQTSLNQTDAISNNTSLQTSLNKTDAKSYNKSLQTSQGQPDANSYNTPEQSSNYQRSIETIRGVLSTCDNRPFFCQENNEKNSKQKNSTCCLLTLHWSNVMTAIIFIIIAGTILFLSVCGHFRQQHTATILPRESSRCAVV
ncbi:MAM and LDL-receptor class A domain-containing protein 1 [Bulinus truncatus]|nr:MAM and LDL-receptor class A domain-containing protein 1 [Bulinus truncatus]